MKNNDDYYKQVEQEIKQGKYQEGLRTRAIAETDGDENKARALYIKFRVESLKAEKEQKRIEDLNEELANLVPIAEKIEMKIYGYGLRFGFVVGAIVGAVYTFDMFNWIYFFIFILITGVLGALIGLIIASYVLDFSPTKRRVDQIKDELKYSGLSPIRRWIKKVIGF